MKHSFIIIDDNSESILKTLAVAARFQNLTFLASATTYDEGLDLILEHRPSIVFLEMDPEDKNSKLSLLLINELHRYLAVVPYVIITANSKEMAYDAIKYEPLDFLIKPIASNDLRKSLLKLEKVNKGNTLSILKESPEAPIKEKSINQAEKSLAIENSSVDDEIIQNQESDPEQESLEDPSERDSSSTNWNENASLAPLTNSKEQEVKPLIICVKSYGDYRFIEAKDICYLQADNNSTDIHLFNGEMITAFKTLKHFENVLSNPFVRIHNSYIVNIDYVSRIHTGNAVCYIKNTTTKLPFSKSYKENVDTIINSITNGNYLEI